jgi:hypothetical protein
VKHDERKQTAEPIAYQQEQYTYISDRLVEIL